MRVSRSPSSMRGATLIVLHEVIQEFGYWARVKATERRGK